MFKFKKIYLLVEMAAFGMGGGSYVQNPMMQNISSMFYNANPMAGWGGSLSNKVRINLLVKSCMSMGYCLLRPCSKCG